MGGGNPKSRCLENESFSTFRLTVDSPISSKILSQEGSDH